MKSLYGLVRAQASKTPKGTALLSPNQSGRLGQPFAYNELQAISLGLAQYLGPNGVGARKGSLVVSDLPNITENLVLQVACSQMQVAYATVKDKDALKQLRDANEVICIPATKESWLTEEFSGKSKALLGNEFEDAAKEWIERGTRPGTGAEADGGIEIDKDSQLAHAYFNSLNPLTNAEVVELGEATAKKLRMTDVDRVLVSITLCHAFGIGSGVGAAFTSGSCVILPAVGGIRGCGIPSERALATLSTLKETHSSLLLADTHIVKNFPADVSHIEGLRGGIVKTGSGSTFLEATINFASVQLNTMGKS